MAPGNSESDKLRFLYSVLKNGKIDKIDWNAVAEANGLTKGATYMRYSRIKSALGDDSSPSTSPNSSPAKGRKRRPKTENDEEPAPDVLASSTKKKRGPRKKKIDMLEHYEGSSSSGDAPLPGSLIVDEFPELASYY